ncbi:hypothetical protein N9V84_06000 [Verrucomicrobiales bacterium]|jgi:hypothetical protein|nr:hypothetical protein [Verrucomicrobiales bacterium]
MRQKHDYGLGDQEHNKANSLTRALPPNDESGASKKQRRYKFWLWG